MMLEIMHRPILYTWFLFLIIVSLIISRRADLPEFNNGLHLCPMPCWAGIIPGQTLLDEVPPLVAAYFQDEILLHRNNRFTAFLIDAPTLNILGEIGSRHGHVNAISLTTIQPLWKILLLLGPPRCVQDINHTLLPGVINIFWEQGGVYVMSSLNPTAANRELLTNTLQIREISPDYPCSTGTNIRPWPGFAALG